MGDFTVADSNDGDWMYHFRICQDAKVACTSATPVCEVYEPNPTTTNSLGLLTTQTMFDYRTCFFDAPWHGMSGD